jgi:hypothetical protein
VVIALRTSQGDTKSDADNTATDDSSAPDDHSTQLRQVDAGFLRYVEDNRLATIAGALIVGVFLARFAFLGNPKDK